MTLTNFNITDYRRPTMIECMRSILSMDPDRRSKNENTRMRRSTLTPDSTHSDDNAPDESSNENDEEEQADSAYEY